MANNVKSIGGHTIDQLKHPLQDPRFALALVCALLLFPLIAVAAIAGSIFLIVPLLAFLFWFTGRVFIAFFIGHSILVSKLNYPRVFNIGEEMRAQIGYDKPIYIFVFEQGSFTAYLTKRILTRKAIFLTSELLENGVSDDELRWLVGRFVGYLRIRQDAGIWGKLIQAAQFLLVFNVFILAYERSLVYTGDRLALAVIHGDISCAVSVMQKLLVGRQLGYSVNPQGIVDQQRQMKGDIFAFFARIGTGFPLMTARYVDLICFSRTHYPGQYARFDADNPGMPLDLQSLIARPQSYPALPRAV